MSESIEPAPDPVPAPVIDHVPVETPKPPRPPKPARPRARGTLLSLLLFLLLGAAGYYAWTNPSPDVARELDAMHREARNASAQAEKAAQQVASVAQTLQSLSDRIDKLEKAPPPAVPAPAPAAMPPDIADLPKRVDDLNARVEALASRPEPARSEPARSDAQAPDTGVTQQALADLNARVAQAFDAEKATVQQLAARLDQITPRLAALEEAAGSTRNVANATVRLTRIEGALVALQAGRPLGRIPEAPPALARFATVAPPTEASLRESFPALADHAAAVSLPDLSGRSFWQRALTRLQSAVTVRQGSDVLVGDPAAGILADARDRVQDGDLAGAVAILHQLTGPAAATMHDWVEQANDLVAARAALADLALHG
jgi:predicted  nucleic acid-binding Zn-ribbon protein